MPEILVPNFVDYELTELTLTAPGQVNRSGWTGKRKFIGLPGIEMWRGKATISQLVTEIEERQWRAFLFSLRGQVNWFKHQLPCNQHAGNKPAVAAGAGNAYTLPLSGMQAGQTILRAGQFMTVPLPSGYDRAVCLTSNLVADGGGLGIATFEPALSEVPIMGATVETFQPFIRMASTSATQGFGISQGVSGTSFDVEEAR